jgi:hypothetical protein
MNQRIVLAGVLGSLLGACGDGAISGGLGGGGAAGVGGGSVGGGSVGGGSVGGGSVGGGSVGGGSVGGGSVGGGSVGGGSVGGGSVGGGSVGGGSVGGGSVDAGSRTPFPVVSGPGILGSVAAPRVVTITFSDDSNAATLQAFDDWLVTSSWLATVGADYGVGLGSNQNFPLSDTSQSSLADGGRVQGFLQTKIADGTLPAPQNLPDGGLESTIYVIYYPASGPTAVPSGSGGYHACASVGGEGSHNTARFNFAVVQDSTLPILEVAGSHELIEAATDPCGWGGYSATNNGSAWTLLGAEVGDLCYSQFLQDSATGYWVQRTWSTSAAAAFIDPCVPGGASDYANVSPSSNLVLHVAAGQSSSIALTGWSSVARAPWNISASWSPQFAPGLVLGAGQAFDPQPTLSAGQLGDGQDVTLTLSVPQGVAPGSWGVVLVNSASDGIWPIEIVAQ